MALRHLAQKIRRLFCQHHICSWLSSSSSAALPAAMATAVTPPRPLRQLNAARPVPRLVHLLCLTCFGTFGALTQLSFVNGGSWCDQRHAKTQVVERMSQQRQESPKALAQDEKKHLKVLTLRVKKAVRANQVIKILEETMDGPIFDFILASAAYHRLATCRGQLKQSDWDSRVIAKLSTRLENMVLQDELGPRESTNTLWSIAKLSDRFSLPTQLLVALVKSLPGKAKVMNQHDLSNCLWASAQLKDIAPDVLQIVPAIAVQIPAKAKSMKPQELSNCLWACVQLQDDAPQVLQIVLPVVVEVSTKIKDMNAQDLSNNLVALLPLQGAVPEIARLMADSDGQENIPRSSAARLSTLLPRLRGKDLSIAVPTVIWGCAKLGVYPDDLLHSVSQHLGSRNKLSKLPGFSLCALAWTYQGLDAQNDFEDFRSLLQAEVGNRGFNAADVESTSLGPLKWSHAKLGARGPLGG